MNADDIKKYWGERASKGHQATTDDVYMKSIEYSVLKDRIATHKPRSVIDIGCGDGKTTVKLAEQFPEIKFRGIDNSEPMINEALKNDVENVTFEVDDVLSVNGSYDMAITVRCIINLPTWDKQVEALFNVHWMLPSGGIYLMIENFTSGHNKMNEARNLYGLKEIPVRDHNLFFGEYTINALATFYDLLEDVNISSTYYLATRCVYTRICMDEGIEPDYFSPHHRYAARLPFAGDYGPIRLLVWRKK